ncbi:MAG TPA: HK97 family phage prohead protease [Puia sp.]
MSVDSDGKLSAEERTIKGYLIVWGVKDDYGTIFLKGSCAKSIQERGPNSNSKYKITALWQHDQKDPIGQFTVLDEDDYGLYFEAVCDAGVYSADRAVIQVRSGTINQFSVGFDYIWDKVEYDEKLDALLLKEIILMEGSAVTIGSNMETYAIRSAEDFENQSEFLRQETESFIKSLPPAKQLEARQLFTRNISLAKAEPEVQKLLALRQPRADQNGIDYKYIKENLKLF